MSGTLCKGCGARIKWLRMAASGTSMPVNEKTERRVLDQPGIGAKVVEVYVSHFVTCTKASEFRKGGRG